MVAVAPVSLSVGLPVIAAFASVQFQLVAKPAAAFSATVVAVDNEVTLIAPVVEGIGPPTVEVEIWMFAGAVARLVCVNEKVPGALAVLLTLTTARVLVSVQAMTAPGTI
jgi:hypothetical protein